MKINENVMLQLLLSMIWRRTRLAQLMRKRNEKDFFSPSYPFFSHCEVSSETTNLLFRVYYMSNFWIYQIVDDAILSSLPYHITLNDNFFIKCLNNNNTSINDWLIYSTLLPTPISSLISFYYIKYWPTGCLV